MSASDAGTDIVLVCIDSHFGKPLMSQMAEKCVLMKFSWWPTMGQFEPLITK